jgi:hypothetical protein
VHGARRIASRGEGCRGSSLSLLSGVRLRARAITHIDPRRLGARTDCSALLQPIHRVSFGALLSTALGARDHRSLPRMSYGHDAPSTAVFDLGSEIPAAHATLPN